jgi:hypothetical protein
VWAYNLLEYENKIHFNDPKNLEESIRKGIYLYEDNKGRTYFQNSWDYKKKGNMDQRNKLFKPHFIKNKSQAYWHGYPTQVEAKITDSLGKEAKKTSHKVLGM